MKAMVLDGVNPKNRGHFFTRNECEALRLQRRIPDKTVVQIGAYDGVAIRQMEQSYGWIFRTRQKQLRRVFRR